MSFAGLKKQFNKANQYMSEKIGGAKGTELDDEFVEMERRIDVLGKLVDDLINKTHEFLQPNPASRAKMSTRNAISKLRGQEQKILYPQPEGTLGDYMIKHGTDLGEDSVFGGCLIEAGESFKHLAEIKYNLEDNVKQNFLEPLNQLQNKDLKEVNHHRKKLSGRRLDFDCKRRKKEKGAAGGSNVTEEELRVAEDKFEESKNLAENAMHNVLENEVEYISQLQAFIEAEVDYHRQALNTLQTLMDALEIKRNDAASRPKSEHIPKRIVSYNRSESPNSYDGPSESLDTGGKSGSYNFNSIQAPSYHQSGFDPYDDQDPFGSYAVPDTKKKPMAKALYDFIAENEGELGFQEGDYIQLISQVDENWYEGSVNGQAGFFPINYVEVINPL
ncbi:endophilin-A3-like isoform X2 [Biomphalaria glabrata]|uniref:Endophilin-A3-like isoform X2 n=1 Tax=Biomphalaria glabrata TaxID=6526 RepID=A0A9W3A9C5_BIOGL|nr:endophilin-A3-like isoform X2 [Biomphalaria glabrata]